MSAPLIDGIKPVHGTLRLVGVRWVVSILAALPATMAAKGALSTAATRPWYTEAPDPLPLPQFFGVMGELGAVMPLVVVGAIVAWLAHQLLTAAAIEILDPARGAEPIRLWRAMVKIGWRYLLIFLRVSLFALVFLLIGSRVLSWIFDGLAERGAVQGWTGKTLVLTLPILHGLLLLAWAGIVGAWAWWSRVILLHGRRRYVRRMVGIVIRTVWRSPLQGFVAHWILGIASVLAGAAVLFAWRQSPGVATGWFLLWLLLLLVQAFVWHWRLRTLHLIWACSSFDDLRARPDAPWGVFRWIRKRLPRRAAASGDASAA